MIGKKIKQIRRDHNLTQDEFGKKLLHTKSTISKWENDQATPDIAALKKISDLFDLDLNTLIQGISTKKRTKKEHSKIFEWKKANYSGNANIKETGHRVLINIIVSIIIVGGFCLAFIPILIARDGMKKSDLIMLLAGLLVSCISIIFIGILMRRRGNDSLKRRFNINFELLSDKLKITSIKTGGVKNIFKNEITSIKSIGDSPEILITILLVNKQNIKLFNVDTSVLENLLNFKKGGLHEH